MGNIVGFYKKKKKKVLFVHLPLLVSEILKC